MTLANTVMILSECHKSGGIFEQLTCYVLHKGSVPFSVLTQANDWKIKLCTSIEIKLTVKFDGSRPDVFPLEIINSKKFTSNTTSLL